MRVERRPCQICGTLTQSIGYKAFVCGACSIFYRRNFKNREQIRCRGNGNCDLSAGNRNTCRALIQCNGFPKDDIDEEEARQNGVICSVPSTTVPPQQPFQMLHDSPPMASSALTAIQQNANYSQLKDETVTQYEEHSPTFIVAGTTSISATNLPGCSKILPVMQMTTGHLTKPTSSSKFSTAYSRPEHIFPSPTSSEPHSTQSIQMMPATPLTSVFDTTPNLYNSSENAVVDDILVGAIVNMKPVNGVSLPSALPSLSTLTPENASEFPMMVKTVRAFARFEERQRCLASIMKGADVQLDGDYVEINMQLYSNMENRTLRLACITIAELLNDCVDLNVHERAAILKSTILEVSSFYKYSLTARIYPEVNNQHMALYPGCFCLLDNIAAFMGSDYERTKHVMEPLWGVGRIGISRFRYLRPTFDESSVMLAIIVWENIERLGIMKEYAEQQRQKLYKEFGYYLSMIHGFGTATTRMIRLMTLLCDVKMYTTAYEDTYSLLGIFLPEDRDAFWCNKPHVSDAQLTKLAFASNDSAQI
ncbi:hypothetical protein M3Y97_00730400 [Aphelenchoides bicaudatus]|nr:hypothetical protein M3Y97_00730400 [Aphelenchoides bicaudatus]